MHFNTWGTVKRDERTDQFNPERHPFIETVRSHLGLTLIEIRGKGEPVQVALGESADSRDPEAARTRVTPFFSNFDALDYFCRMNLRTYLAYDPTAKLPRQWFWQSTRGFSGPVGSQFEPGSLSPVQVTQRALRDK